MPSSECLDRDSISRPPGSEIKVSVELRQSNLLIIVDMLQSPMVIPLNPKGEYIMSM